jgi:hypothetical protein
VFLWIACCLAGVLALASGEARAAPLRPDLAITSVMTNRVSLVGRPFYVSATVIERSRRVGARARITVTANDIALATKNIVVRPGRRLVVKLPVALAAPEKTRLVTAVTGTKPVEAVISNNVRRATVDVAEFRARWSSVVVPSFGGYGGQFNHHVYSALSRAVGINDTNVVDMEQKMRALHPQFSRIFFTPQAFTDPDKMQSFVRTVLFAQSTGTTINITWQGGTLSVASGTVQKFANVLLDLVRNRGVTNLRWLTLQNEPNRTRMTMQQYETQYRELDAYIQSIRGQVRYMGGDLVRAPDGGAPNQAAWFQYMASRMSDILDAYSIHVFWDYWDTQKLVDRLKEVRAIVNTLPQQARKPIYVTEYGVRGLRVFNGAPQVDPGVWQDGSAIGQTNVSAFQQAWFDVLAANLGYVATSKWDSYFGRYDNGTQAYYFIGDPQNGWPLYPLYNLVQLLTTTVKREWKVAAVDSVPATSRLLGAYLGKNGQQTMVGLDTAGAQLNTASPTPISYSIAGLPLLKTLQLVVWNEAGNGLVGPARSVSTDAAGVASITVPQQGVFVLTTLRLPSS